MFDIRFRPRMQRPWLACFMTVLLTLVAVVAGGQSGFAQWPELRKGFAPDTVFDIDGLDSINLLNGNLTLAIPLGQRYPVSSTLSYGLSLVYNANPWEELKENRHECQVTLPVTGNMRWVDFYPKTLDRLSNAGVGWTVHLGRFQPSSWDYYGQVDEPPFTYIGPDGGRHGLHEELHYDQPPTPPTPNTYYSRDGSFLRMEVGATCTQTSSASGVCRRLEMPDGSVQEFHNVSLGGDEDFRPTLISDAFGNQVVIDYFAYRWTLTDDHGRQQFVDFDSETPARSYSRVDQVTLTAFGGDDAIYGFEYAEQPATIKRHQYEEAFVDDLKCGAIRSIAGSGLLGPDVDQVVFLERLVLPDGSFYEMSYDQTDSSAPVDGTLAGLRDKSGAIDDLRLPSGLHYRWLYTYAYGRTHGDPRTPNVVKRVSGVGRKQRYIVDASGMEQGIVTWEYAPKRSFFSGNEDPDPGQPLFTPCFQTTDVRFWTGDRGDGFAETPIRHTRHYFSTAVNGPVGNSFNSRQSLPFTPCIPNGDGDYYTDGLYLSQEIFDPSNGARVRSIWVDYETDAPRFVDDKDGDKRLWRQRTVFDDDGGHWVESRSSDFDGLGNFRLRTELADFGASAGGGSTPTEARTNYTGYNLTVANGSPSGPFFTPGSNDPWQLGLYSEHCLVDGEGGGGCQGAQERTLYDFQPQTGFLRAMRQLRGSGGTASGTDILTVFADADSDGNVDSEQRYGGDRSVDGEALLPASEGFSPGGASVDYDVAHTYTHGVRSRSVVYNGSTPVLETLDHTIDTNTGRVAKSREPSDLETVLDFDTMGRLIKVETPDAPAGTVASRLFRYTVATVDDASDLTFPQVLEFCGTGTCLPMPLGLGFEVRDCPQGTGDYDACGSTPFTERRYFYDRQGRKVVERRRIPWTAGGADGAESRRRTAFDLADRKVSESDWYVADHGFPVFHTSYSDFDVFDRSGTISRPDGKATTFTYQGDRQVSRTAGVWTGSSETPSTTTELRDGLGRLTMVSEPSGAGGSQVHSTYTHDAADRLRTVCVNDADQTPGNPCQGQARSFTYDAAGFLTSESHPEIDGTIGYRYNALGNLLTKDLVGTAYDLAYTYDPAGRPIEVYDGNGDLFQEMFYARNNEGPRRAGLMYQARRHNRLPEALDSSNLIDHVVTETFDHSAPGDRLASYKVRSSQGASFETRYTYHPLGIVNMIDYPTCDRAPCSGLGASLSLTYNNEFGQVAGIPDWVDRVLYRPDGRPSRIEHANGITDGLYQNPQTWKPIEKMDVRRGSDVLWDSGSYEFDGSGNIYEIGDERFKYDRVSRLVDSTVATVSGASVGTATESVTYDIFGNIRTIDRSTDIAIRQLDPSPQTNRLGSSLAAYDVAGNVTSWTEANQDYVYTYGPDNRISTITGNGQSRSFLYTASGERFALFDHAKEVEEYTPRDVGNGLLSRYERSGSGDWSRAKDYIRLGSKTIAMASSEGIRHLHHDHLGSTRLVTDAMGNPVGDLTTYFPFGSYASNGTLNGDEHRFTGHERDTLSTASASLDYMHARHYAPAVGRFLSVDPVLGSAGIPGSWNRYSYTRGNPVKFVDPDGRIVVQARMVPDKSQSDATFDRQLNRETRYRSLFSVTYETKANEALNFVIKKKAGKVINWARKFLKGMIGQVSGDPFSTNFGDLLGLPDDFDAREFDAGVEQRMEGVATEALGVLDEDGVDRLRQAVQDTADASGLDDDQVDRMLTAFDNTVDRARESAEDEVTREQ